MTAFLEVINEFRPKNGQTFAIADVNDLRGGYILVTTIEEMNAFLTTNKLKYGMLCYVKEVPDDIHMFIYRGTWEVWEGQGGSGGGGLSLVVVEDLDELAQKTAIQIRGQIVYVNSLDDLRFWNGQYWESFRKIYIQDTPPDDKGGIWIDTTEEGYNSSLSIIQDMLRVINILLQKVNRLMYMLTEIDPGDFTNNMSTSQDELPSEEPHYGTSEEEDNETQSTNALTELLESPEPDYLNDEYSPNTKCLKVKSGTLAYMKNHSADFAERELLWCYDTQTLWIKDPKTLQLIKIGATNGGSEEPIDIETDMDGIIQETINNYKRITGIEFVDMMNSNNLYTLGVKNGNLTLIDKSFNVEKTKLKVATTGDTIYYSPLYYPLGDEHSSVESPFIYINMVYCGGDSDKYSYNPVSHSFIELCNISTKDLNLNGLYLHYSEGEAVVNRRQWITLPLTGHIPAGHTFLIRCAPCSVYDSNTTLIRVGEPDMEWTYSSTKNPEVLEIAATNETPAHSVWDENNLLKLAYSCSIYLSGGFEDAELEDYSIQLATPFDNKVFTSSLLFSNGNVAKYFVDLLGIGEGMECCNNPFNNVRAGLTPNNCLIFRYFNMDPVKLALKAPSALDNSNKTQWTYFNLASINPKVDISLYVPGNSKSGKSIFFNKAKLVEGPNVVTCSFGWNAHRTRCFNWISKGYYDEFIKIWPEGSDENNASIYESFKEGDGRSGNGRNWDNAIYNRIRNVATSGEDYTVHKFIHDFDEPIDTLVYNYKVGREGHWSDTHKFTMRNRDLVIQRGFLFLQHTDQQGFHDEEYETWGITADFIKNDGDIDPDKAYEWTMNTGDQTLNGNRLNEWLAFYRCGANLFRDKEQMFTIGNNDLCSEDPKVLGNGEDINKVNPENINFFFTFEFPYDIPEVAANGKYIPSLYSFIYGDVYFLCMNSEFTKKTLQDLYEVSDNYSVDDDPEGPTGIYSIIRQWCQNDLQHIDNKIKWKVAFTHDNPFTLLTRSQIYGTSSGNTINYTYLGEDMQTENVAYSRGGSHLNSVGNYWFSKFLEDNNFRLCIGGHKHTYTCSRLMRDNPNNRMKPFVYDPNYSVVNGDPVYPLWYTDLGGPKSHLMLFGDLYDGQGNELTYVRYVTLQATGFKTTSNKELPTANIPWLLAYYPASGTAPTTDRFASETKNGGQNYPHYILWKVGKGTEVEDPNSSTTERNRILGRVYKTQPSTNRKSGWTYTYNIPYTGALLEKIPGNGQNNPSNNIIVELSYAPSEDNEEPGGGAEPQEGNSVYSVVNAELTGNNGQQVTLLNSN